jgi:uncharacterized protein (TIGR03435 family)
MKKLVLLMVVLGAMSGLSLRAQVVLGDWQGTLHAGGTDLRLVVKVTQDAGKLKVVVYSIDQGGQSLNGTGAVLEGATFKFLVPSVNGSYDGRLSADGKMITGTWTQAQPLALTLLRATPETEWDIPAPPVPEKPMAADADPAFDVATIKPNNSGATSLQQFTVHHNLTIRNGSLGDLIGFAFNVQARQIVGAATWMNSDRFDIDGVPDKQGAPSLDQVRTMIRKLLAERFALKFHSEKREMAAFVLAAGKGGPKMAVSEGGSTLPSFGTSPVPGGVTLNAMNATLDEFSSYLQMLVVDRPVVNQSGITGRHSFKMTFLPDDSMFNGHPPTVPAETASAPALLEAMGQVGLKLTSEKTPVDVIVIDHVEKPSAN